MGKNSEKREARKTSAINNILYIATNLAEETNYSIINTKREKYPPRFSHNFAKKYASTSISVLGTDSVGALFDVVSQNCVKKKIAILDFASYNNPGGGYLNGSKAQEEDLCSKSNLYPCLEVHMDDYYIPHRKDSHRGLYTSDALYIPDIIFEEHDPGFASCNDIQYRIRNTKRKAISDVVVMAAPNANRAIENGVSEKDIENAVRERIGAAMGIAAKMDVDIYIVGAFGCGCFGNDPYVVGRVFAKWIAEHDGIFQEVIFAIPGGNNLDVFKKIFE